MDKVSLIIRTKNEERWIKPCLDSLIKQSYSNFEVIIVDNNSIDDTLKIINNHTLINKIKIVKIQKYIPGESLNIGIKAASGKVIVCISAHCIPGDDKWLKNLVSPLNLDSKIVATYGRQIPMPYSNPDDVRDLLLVFSKDERYQKNDYFFHNAHSAFFKSIWKKFPFSESLTNIEDREFGKNLIENGYTIYYNPKPVVYHYHGIHQSNNKKRLSGVIRIIKSLDNNSEFHTLPEVCSINNMNSILFLPITESELSNEVLRKIEILNSKVFELTSLKKIIIIGYKSIKKQIDNYKDIVFFDREKIKNNLGLGIFELFKEVCLKLNYIHEYQLGIYINLKYDINIIFEGIEKRLINFPQTGADIVFPAKKDYGYYWYFDEEDEMPISFERTLRMKNNRNLLFKACYGLGSVFDLFALKQGELLGKKILLDEIKS